MRLTFGGLGLTAAATLACGGLTGVDLATVDLVAAAIEGADPAMHGTLAVVGLTETAAVLPRGCSEALHGAYATADPAQKTTLVAYALAESCPRTCAHDVFDSIAMDAPEERTRVVLAACDAKGPDPVFGAVGELRAEMDAIDYLVARLVLEPVMAAGAGSEREATYERLARDVAVSFALQNAPRDGKPGDPLRASANVDAAKAEEALGSARAAMTSCGEADGVARIVTAPDGSVVAVELVSDTGWEVRDCVRAALEKATFAPTSGYGVIDAGFDTAPVAAAVPPGAGFGGTPRRESAGLSPGRPTISGPLSADVVTRVVRRQTSQLRDCYEKELAKDPTVAGRLELGLTIGDTGTVTAATVGESTLPATMDACVAAAAKRWGFPALEGGGTVSVTYPFVFRAD